MISGQLNYLAVWCRLCVLFNGSMTLAVQGQGHSIRITDIEKMAYFGEITGPRSLSV